MVILICLLLVVPCTAEVIVCFPMDSDPDWTTEGQWEFGVPQGGGGPYSYDPTSGHTGANVYGYNLAGNYDNDMPEYKLTTMAIDCKLAENVKLTFWRWLGVESSTWDHAKVQVSNNGTSWTDVWSNGTSDLIDTEWVYCEYDISAVADAQQTVYVRWCMGPTDFSAAYAGWNIDDVCLDGDTFDALSISPSDGFLSAGPEGGPFEPPCKSYTLTNNDTSALNWTAAGTQSWLDVTPGSGTLTPGASVPVEMCVNSTANTLSEGLYTDTLSFTNTDSGFSYMIDATLYVGTDIVVPVQYSTIQSAIDASSDGDTIIVLDGTHRGDGNRDIDFNGRAITLKSVNGPESCIIDCQKSTKHRGFHFHSGEDSNSVLDGFTITGSWANEGAGVRCVNSSPKIINCIIKNCGSGFSTTLYGGGIYCDNSSPEIVNCTIRDNTAWQVYGGSRGGGMCNRNNSNPTLINCIFYRNQSGEYAGGVYNAYSNPTLVNCIFSSNYAGGDESRSYGGGICNIHSNPTLTNCIFHKNSSRGGYAGTGIYYAGYGGGMWNSYSKPVLNNCTFVGNYVQHGGSGYGLKNVDSSKATLTNCIFWGNGLTENQQISSDPTGVIINYSCVQGWTGSLGGSGNIDDDPCFGDTSSDDYHLKSGAGRWDANSESWVQDDVNSPCIDAGDTNSDWTAELWPHGKRINMGAYGGTPQASMSLSDAGNIADLNTDDFVGYRDMMLFTDKWLFEAVLLAEDLDRSGFVNFIDFAIFANNW